MSLNNQDSKQQEKSTNTIEQLSAYQVGQVVNAVGAELDTGKTTPPPRYTESSLIADMKSAWKFAKSDEERAILRESEGIGTARTREPILSGLIRRKLIESKKVRRHHELTSSELGRAIIARLPVWLTDVVTTAKWEMALNAIQNEQTDPQAVLDMQIAYVRQIIERAKSQVK